MLPHIISRNQLDFMKGRSNVENVQLEQEIVRDINKRNKFQNVVVKLDMTKAYNIMSWIYLTMVMRNFEFNKRIIDTVCRLVSGNWYSVLMNRKNYVFFSNNQGI